MNAQRWIGRVATFALAAFAGAAGVEAQDFAVRAGTIETMGPAGTIQDGVVVVQGGRIVAVGPALEVRVPAGIEFIVLPEGVVTPGLINAHSTVGLAGTYNTPHDQDLAEQSADVAAEVRALDGFNYREDLLAWVRALGTTVVHAVPGGSGPAIAGQSAVFKTWGRDTDSMLLRAPATMAFQLGEGAKSRLGYPDTRMGVVAVIRAELERARRYAARRADDPTLPRDLGLEALSAVLAGDVAALVTARREDDIVTALRLAEEFQFRLILDGATEAYLVAEHIADAGVPVFVGPSMELEGSLETENVALENAAILANRGVEVAMQTGFSEYVPKTRIVLFEAAMAAANGLGFERALASITSTPARLLGIDDRVGSLEVGKDGDLVLFNGDPFEYLSAVEVVVIDGHVVHRRQ